ncbi:DUF4865 family protein [Rhizobium sp. BK251]|uniref:DUF4865 family protein n=1 Tax=Rhizobium sp. BK251 TaxID=2512125 RepID=UPI00104D8E82|nr:DUF4865 family protein [Rhizobium sp. BK251]TCL69725.1 uncharacterized protein DUF4865 [Rhizobium sp. BK251]
MIAMQYSFTLPADYDMAIIDRRIRDRGPGTDGFPHLRFKAYLSARKGEFGSRENLYAPFYLWDEPEGASNFITGPGFDALTQAFGRPSIHHWIVWHAETAPGVDAAQFAMREVLPIDPQANLADLRAGETRRATLGGSGGSVLASVSAFEPRTWTIVRFNLYRDMPPSAAEGQVYRVGHMSLPAS